jgi:hypothetical protein
MFHGFVHEILHAEKLAHSGRSVLIGIIIINHTLPDVNIPLLHAYEAIFIPMIY